jgi:hypothetical protein
VQRAARCGRRSLPLRIAAVESFQQKEMGGRWDRAVTRQKRQRAGAARLNFESVRHRTSACLLLPEVTCAVPTAPGVEQVAPAADVPVLPGSPCLQLVAAATSVRQGCPRTKRMWCFRLSFADDVDASRMWYLQRTAVTTWWTRPQSTHHGSHYVENLKIVCRRRKGLVRACSAPYSTRCRQQSSVPDVCTK